MQLTNVVLNVMAKNPKQHDLTIKFRWPTPEEIEETRQVQLRLDKAKALAFVEVGGKTAEKKTRTRSEARAMGLLLDDPKGGAT